MTVEKSAKPQRTCVACRKAADKNQLLRFVLAPDGQLVVDYRQQLPGRGLYTCIARKCLELAVKKNSFRRISGSQHMLVDTDQLFSQLLWALEQRLSGLIRMARKSGQLVDGSNQVLDALKGRTPPAIVVVAADISDNIRDKIEIAADRQQIVVAQLFDKALLGQMIGKEERSVIGVLSGALAEALKSELDRYELVREN